MSKAVEVINAVVSPVTKLIKTVSSAIGKAYEPTHIKRMAKARAREIEEIGRALRENADIPITYSNGEIVADTKDFDQLVKRTQSRMAFQELQKQQNIESVVDKAYGLLDGEPDCTDVPVDNDWLSRFFNSVENISDNDMQLLWARILAGEVKQPKTYSLRTLETLKNISKDEALLFQKMTAYVFTIGLGKYIFSNDAILEKNGTQYRDIVLLRECGLLTDLANLTINNVKDKDLSAIYTEKRIVIFDCARKKDMDVDMSVYMLTTVGRELFDIVQKEFNNEYILDLAEKLYNVYRPNVKIKVFRVTSIQDDTINYEDNPIKVFDNEIVS